VTADGARIRLLFADGGAYHTEVVTLPKERLARYERLIDCLREDPEFVMILHVDVGRLCAAYVIGEDSPDGDGPSVAG
jgi:hypothetical protein